MSKKVIQMSLTPASIQQAIQEVENHQKWIVEKTKELVDRLASRGYQIMSVNFEHAVYDGTNDVRCDIREAGENKVALLALGDTALFIEFGTGVKYPDDHPERFTGYAEGMAHRGEYGKGKGKNPNGWRYVGEAGTNGVRSKAAKVKSVIHTYGNPANMCMYNTKIQLEEDFEHIARSVFNND